jgi:hypothetical protein
VLLHTLLDGIRDEFFEPFFDGEQFVGSRLSMNGVYLDVQTPYDSSVPMEGPLSNKNTVKGLHPTPPLSNKNTVKGLHLLLLLRPHGAKIISSVRG